MNYPGFCRGASRKAQEELVASGCLDFLVTDLLSVASCNDIDFANNWRNKKIGVWVY